MQRSPQLPSAGPRNCLPLRNLSVAPGALWILTSTEQFATGNRYWTIGSGKQLGGAPFDQSSSGCFCSQTEALQGTPFERRSDGSFPCSSPFASGAEKADLAAQNANNWKIALSSSPPRFPAKTSCGCGTSTRIYLWQSSPWFTACVCYPQTRSKKSARAR